jgi:drug/metabolite transporter (DMT)-like permease
MGLLIACLLWAISFIATKVALGTIPPLTVVALRLLISSLCFALWFIITRRKVLLPTSGWLGRLFVLSLFGTGLHYGIQTIGLQYTTASNASIYAATCPITIAVIAALLLDEKLTWSKGAGIAVALAGVLIVMGAETVLTFDLTGHLMGDLLVFASVFMWGIFTVYGKKLTGDMGAFQVIALTTILGSVWMLPIGWVESDCRAFSLSSVTAEAWGAIAFLGIMCSFLATLLYFLALERTESQKVGIYLYTIPPMTYIIAAVYLNEAIGLNLVAGSLLVLGGVYLTERG